MAFPDTHKYTSVQSGNAYDGNALDEAIVLDERFVTPLGPDTPSTEGLPFLEVVAPATLPEGYTFEADVNGQSFTVRVPIGGVEGGQKFSVPFQSSASMGYAGAAIPRVSVPVGHWRDSCTDCFKHGICHPMLCNAWCCPLIAAGQVMRRLNLTWFGNEGSIAQTASTFRICLYITIVYNVLDQLLKYYPLHVALLDWYTEDKLSQIMVTFGLLRSFLELSFYIFLVCVVAKTRAYVRNKYSIPEKSCHGCEDCCCAVWCPCLTVSQMARHTADYTTYAGTCCSQTGLPSHVPGIV